MKSNPGITSVNSNYTPSTDELEHEIKTVPNIENYLKRNSAYMLAHTLPEHLNMLLSQKGISRAEVARCSLLNRTYIYQIFSGEKNTSRDNLIAIAFGLRLSDEEAQELLKLSGNRKLYAKDKRDAIILFSLHHQKTIWDTNNFLYEHGFNLLGSLEK